MLNKKLIILAAFALMAACGDSDDNNHDNHDNADHGENHDNHDHGQENHADGATIGADACEHMEGGPEEAIAAVAATETPNAATATHTRYDITLPESGAILAVEIAEAANMHFFFNADVTLTVAGSDGTALSASETLATVDECTDVVEGEAYDLGVGTYTLTFETDATELSMVMVPEGEEGHNSEHSE